MPNVFNTAVDIPKEAKDLPAIVLGRKEADVKLALAVAKKYRYVYLCSETMELDCSDSTFKKLKQTTNIVFLPNTKPIGFSTANSSIKSVEFDNYSTITCSAIYVKTDVSPDTACISSRVGLIKANEEGYLETNNLESTLVPRCYAVGSCAQKCTKRMINKLIDTILADFGGN